MTKKRKMMKMLVTVSVPHWMTAAKARREVRTTIGTDYSGYLSSGPNGEEAEVRARKVEPVR